MKSPSFNEYDYGVESVPTKVGMSRIDFLIEKALPLVPSSCMLTPGIAASLRRLSRTAAS